MNAEPHRHDLKVQGPTYCGSVDSLRYCLRYGDQHLHAFAWTWRLEKRLARKAKRIVKRHDRESLKAGEREVVVARARSQEFYVSTWGGPNVDEQQRQRIAEQRQRDAEWQARNPINNAFMGRIQSMEDDVASRSC